MAESAGTGAQRQKVLNSLEAYALGEARAEAGARRWSAAMEWLEQIPEGSRPAALEVGILDGLIRSLLAQQRWGQALDLLQRRLRLSEDPLSRIRHKALLIRQPLLSDEHWLAMSGETGACERLGTDAVPGLDGVWAAGPYYSRGAKRGSPWSSLVRAAKDPDAAADGWARVGLLCGYAGRFLAERTPLLGLVDCVVAVPARPSRYVDRMMSLPDELGKALMRYVALPYLPYGLVSTVDDLEMRKLSRAERYTAVSGSLAAGRPNLIKGRAALVVDDVITSGATLQEAARQLRQVGALEVYGLALAHTEG
jgi:hypothetical protein